MKKSANDCSDTKGVLRLVKFISSSDVEPFKRWLAAFGSERPNAYQSYVTDTDKATNNAVARLFIALHSEGKRPQKPCVVFKSRRLDDDLCIYARAVNECIDFP